MRLSLMQISGIALYEMRMQWRRRTLLIMFSIFIFAIVAIQFPPLPSAEGLPDLAAEVPMAVLILLAVIAAITAEIVPLDRQLHVHDLLHTLPMTRVAYLVGKVLSVWIGLIAGLLVVGTMFAVVAATTETLDLGLYINLWLVQLPHILLAGSAPVLAASLLASRREAALLSLLIAPYLLVRYVFAVIYSPTPLQGLFGLAGHLVVVIAVVWAVTRWQENRA